MILILRMTDISNKLLLHLGLPDMNRPLVPAFKQKNIFYFNSSWLSHSVILVSSPIQHFHTSHTTLSLLLVIIWLAPFPPRPSQTQCSLTATDTGCPVSSLLSSEGLLSWLLEL